MTGRRSRAALALSINAYRCISRLAYRARLSRGFFRHDASDDGVGEELISGVIRRCRIGFHDAPRCGLCPTRKDGGGALPAIFFSGARPD